MEEVIAGSVVKNFQGPPVTHRDFLRDSVKDFSRTSQKILQNFSGNSPELLRKLSRTSLTEPRILLNEVFVGILLESE